MYDPILARSFSKNEQKKFAAYAFLICLIVILSLCTVLRPQFHLSVLNVKLSGGASLDMLVVRDSSMISDQLEVSETGIISETVQLQESPALLRSTDTKSAEIQNKSQLPIPLHNLNLEEPHVVVNSTEDILTKISENINASLADLPSQTSKQQEPTPLLLPIEAQQSDTKLICSVSERLSDYCEIEGNIRIIGNISTILVPSSANIIPSGNSSWRIKPYARKGNGFAMEYVKEWTIKAVDEAHESIPSCTKTYTTPAILFSVGGFSGNYFHGFSDVLVPLFSNSRIFQGEVHFLATNYKSWWISKFQTLFDKLSNHRIIDIDKEEGVHCYKSVLVGLKAHKELGIDISKSPNGYSMKDFRHFLRSTYSLERKRAIKIRKGDKNKPRLMIISRAKTRKLLNEGEISKLAQRLGYEVVVAESTQSTNVSKFAEMVNSCDVFMGVHGAGLTNLLFLPNKAIIIQVVPIGEIEVFADMDFGIPSKDMDLRYLSYNIELNESSLIKQYPLDHQVIRDPKSIHRQGWDAIRITYLENQDVKLDIQRFRPVLSRALKLLHR